MGSVPKSTTIFRFFCVKLRALFPPKMTGLCAYRHLDEWAVLWETWKSFNPSVPNVPTFLSFNPRTLTLIVYRSRSAAAEVLLPRSSPLHSHHLPPTHRRCTPPTRGNLPALADRRGHLLALLTSPRGDAVALRTICTPSPPASPA